MADAEATDTAPPVVDRRATLKRPAATLAQPAAAPPSSGNKGARVMKRPSIKRRLAATEAKRPASHQRGAESGSSHAEEENEAEAPRGSSVSSATTCRRRAGSFSKRRRRGPASAC